MFAQVNLKLIGPLDQLRIVWQVGEAMLESIQFDEDPEGTRYNVLLALQEMVTNVLRHAYECDESQPIDVEFTVDADVFSVMLRDRGPAFDPLAHDTAQLDYDDSMPVEVGGFGIYIARMVMDEVGYRRLGNCNELSMRKFARVPSRLK